MKVIQVNCMYKRGSTGKIVFDLHNELLSKGYHDLVYYGRGASSQSDNVRKFCYEIEAHIHHFFVKYCGILRYGGNFISTYRVIKAIEEQKPDIVHIHCINCYCINIYRLLYYLGSNGIKTVITHHAEFLYTGNCPHAYNCNKWQKPNGCFDCTNLEEATGTKIIDRSHISWLKMKKAFDSFQEDKCINVAVSPWVKSRIKLSVIAKRLNCVVVNNGVDTDIFKYKPGGKLHFEGDYDATILHVTSSFSLDRKDPKGGWMIVQLANMLPNIRFVVVCLNNQVKEDELPINIHLWGAAKNREELASLYSAANVTLVLSKRETYSMVTAESLCCGTPVVGFLAGGPESIAIEKFSTFVEYGDLNAIKESICKIIIANIQKADVEREAKKIYANSTMLSNYLSIYNSLYKAEQ